jgi:tetratricopeptide (TPR) repeat protein
MKLALLIVLCGCHAAPPSGPVQPAAAPRFPNPSLKTTAAEIAVSNFMELYRLAGDDATQRVGLLLTHAQYFGVLDDYTRALQVAERNVRKYPKVAEAYEQRAAARQALHQFDGALADLAQAAKLGGDEETARAGILQALGRYDEALALRRRAVDKRRTFSSVAALAQLEGEMGRGAEAEALFAEAEQRYEDPSPFPLAWLYFQAGLLDERNGWLASARELYQAAHDRLPQYAPAASHLAALLDKPAAEKVVRQIVAVSDDPEYAAQLGALTGDQALIDGARRRYQDLVARHPAAFADHAARFLLRVDPLRALALARANAGLRPTQDSYDLLVEAAGAAGDVRAGCDAAHQLGSFNYLTPAHRFRADLALEHCRL